MRAHRPAIDQRVGADRAQPEAIDRLQRHLAVGARLAHRHAEPLGRRRFDRRPAPRLAGFGAAQLDDMLARRPRAEIMVEGDHAMHLGAAEVQPFGDERHGLVGNGRVASWIACSNGSSPPRSPAWRATSVATSSSTDLSSATPVLSLRSRDERAR